MHAVVFEFAGSRESQHAREPPGVTPTAGWRGTPVCDQFSGYKARLECVSLQQGCLTQARRMFCDLWVNNQSAVAEQALRFFTHLYDVELHELSVKERLQRHRSEAKPVADLLRAWLLQQRALVPSGSATFEPSSTAGAAETRCRTTRKMDSCRDLELDWALRLVLPDDAARGGLLALTQVEDLQATRSQPRIRAKAEHPFRAIKRQFGHVKVRHTGAWPRTPCSCTRCLRCPTCGWRGKL